MTPKWENVPTPPSSEEIRTSGALGWVWKNPALIGQVCPLGGESWLYVAPSFSP